MKKIKKILKKLFYRLPCSYAIMLHHVDNGTMVQKSSCVLAYDKFVELIDSGIRFISMDEYLTFSAATSNACTLTFDDALADVYTVVYPELKKRNIPFTVFVIVNFLDTEGYITTAQLEEMAKDPLVNIGSHGLTHEVLKGKTREMQETEICQSAQKLACLTGRPIRQFAYSHGQYDKTTLEILATTACYDCAFGVSGNPTNAFTKKIFELPRLNGEDRGKRFDVVRCKNGAKIKMR